MPHSVLRHSFLLALSASAALAQTAAPPPGASDPVIALSEFDVTEKNANGYAASESMTGSRVATAIKDLPFDVNVITSELLNDLGTFQMDSSVAFASGFSGLNQNGTFNLRGFNSSFQLRDGFFRLGRFGTSGVDRIEIIKGPNAAIYGEASPGGAINVISKQPSQTAEESLALDTGSYHTYKAEVQAGGPLDANGNTTYIADLNYVQRAYDEQYTELRNREAYLALKHRFDPSSSLQFQYEYFMQFWNAAQQPDPSYFSSTSKTYTGGMAYNLATLNEDGPDSYLRRGVNSFTGIYEKRFSEVWSLRMGANYYNSHSWNYNVASVNSAAGIQYNYLLGTVTKGAPGEQQFSEVGDAVQSDLVAHYKLLNEQLENKELFTFDASDYYRWVPKDVLAAAFQKLPVWNPVVTLSQPIDYTTPAWPGDQNEFNRTVFNKNRGTIYGGMFRHQSTLLGGRLLLYTSLRYDFVDLNLESLLAKYTLAHGTSHAWSPSVGYNYKLTPNLALYGSYSEGYNANVQGQSATSGLQPNESDWGYDYGVKGDFFDDKLQFTAGGYYTVRKNVSVLTLLPDGTEQTEAEGRTVVRGFDVDFTWTPSAQLTFGGGWGHDNAKITNDGVNYMAVGRSPALVPADNVGLYARYNFTGWLNGLYANVAYTYIGPTHPYTPEMGDTYSAADVFVSSTGQWSIKIPGYDYTTVALHYNLRTGAYTQQVSVFVKNVFNRFYIQTDRNLGDSRGYYVGYTLKH